MNKSGFERQLKDDIAEALERFKAYRDDLEERLKQEPDDDEARDLLEDAEEGITALEPIVTDYDRMAADPEQLITISETYGEWKEKEAEMAERLKK